METVFEAQHTHFYPGHEGSITGDSPARSASGSPIRVAFSDGSMAAGLLNATDDGWVLDVAPYRTGAGTKIPAKRWQVALSDDPSGRTQFRVEKKLPVNNDNP